MLAPTFGQNAEGSSCI